MSEEGGKSVGGGEVLSSEWKRGDQGVIGPGKVDKIVDEQIWIRILI